ncbi:MAG: hypothetical protein JWM80_2382, partial [Cyanobacteria bacterium RYN_339]|nr:hypothetical protein [Cyanobacteria bacterium RYN_339]
MVVARNVGPTFPGLQIAPLPRIPDVNNPAAPNLPGVQGGNGGDVNVTGGAQTADVGFVNPDLIKVPGALALDNAGRSRYSAGVGEAAKGDLDGAVKDFQKAAEDFEREADLLLAALKPAAQPGGGGAPPAPALPATPPAPPPA